MLIFSKMNFQVDDIKRALEALNRVQNEFDQGVVGLKAQAEQKSLTLEEFIAANRNNDLGNNIFGQWFARANYQPTHFVTKFVEDCRQDIVEFLMRLDRVNQDFASRKLSLPAEFMIFLRICRSDLGAPAFTDIFSDPELALVYSDNWNKFERRLLPFLMRFNDDVLERILVWTKSVYAENYAPYLGQ